LGKEEGLARHLRLEYEGAIYHIVGMADGSGLGNLLKIAREHVAKNRRLKRIVEKLSK